MTKNTTPLGIRAMAPRAASLAAAILPFSLIDPEQSMTMPNSSGPLASGAPPVSTARTVKITSTRLAPSSRYALQKGCRENCMAEPRKRGRRLGAAQGFVGRRGHSVQYAVANFDQPRLALGAALDVFRIDLGAFVQRRQQALNALGQLGDLLLGAGLAALGGEIDVVER